MNNNFFLKKTVVLFLCLAAKSTIAQPIASKKEAQAFNSSSFRELVNTNIPGTPKLGKPELIITYSNKPVLGEGYGWAAPAFYDWDKDGKKDLLIGEFASGLEYGKGAFGNFAKVYLNIGTDTNPIFEDDFQYASPLNGYASLQGVGEGTPLSISTWCCFPFQPQFFDLNADGFDDIVTGQYNPGDVNWFRGTKEGFLPGEKLIQAGYTTSKKNSNLPLTDTNSNWYWNYSSVSFGDFDDDDDLDMIVGGGALRISRNIGTREKPQFDYRELLFDINGEPLKVYNYSNEEIANNHTSKYFISGTYALMPKVVDWDNDGALDILVTNDYIHKGLPAVTFFKGIKTPAGYRFQRAVSLFTVKDGEKEFPGSWLNISVTDFNGDDVNDLLVGTSVAYTEGAFDHSLSWTWEEDSHILKKNPALYSSANKARQRKYIEKAEKLEKELGIEEVRKRKLLTKQKVLENYYGKPKDSSLVHKGYVYVMLGQKEK